VEGELDLRLAAQRETARKAEIFSELRLLKSRQPVEGLFEGRWA
jgi:hypothetical protein